MCRLCELAAESATYTSKIKLMQEEDSSRLERTKGFMGKFTAAITRTEVLKST